ncbi:MAG: hypothetical protein BJ554DRAFT_612 [Olpidium bornovanus]|uniref:Uncharacterized protein n=1 Tax=Olpidium bornovanus TaxID=278681 RepID=A0A8H7ZU43_9FUNG|nr:MAG: hypothetical protein BJ554DRAFT_612 [Olpidium bornovanus]
MVSDPAQGQTGPGSGAFSAGSQTAWKTSSAAWPRWPSAARRPTSASVEAREWPGSYCNSASAGFYLLRSPEAAPPAFSSASVDVLPPHRRTISIRYLTRTAHQSHAEPERRQINVASENTNADQADRAHPPRRPARPGPAVTAQRTKLSEVANGRQNRGSLVNATSFMLGQEGGFGQAAASSPAGRAGAGGGLFRGAAAVSPSLPPSLAAKAGRGGARARVAGPTPPR